MSFSQELKSELCGEEIQIPHYQQAFAYGMLLLGKSFSAKQMALSTENEQVATCYSHCIAQLSGVETEILFSPQKNKDGIYTVSLKDEEACTRLLESFSHSKRDINLRIQRENFPDEGSIAYFLRGAYLSCGNLTDPIKSYHLEFVTQHLRLAEDLTRLIGEILAPPKITARRGVRVVYYKESEHIEDILTFMGATRCALELMNVKIYKDLRNKANRVTNCETANIEKTITAAAKQVEDIKLIDRHRGLSSLPEDLGELARLRLENPEMSLADLGRALCVPLSRSGVNHRFERIAALAKGIREKYPEEVGK